MLTIKRADSEVDAVLNAVNEKIAQGRTKYHGMTYEQGLEDGIRWLIGETDDHPYPENEE